MTNFLAILLAGGTVLTIIGLGKLAISKEQARFRRGAYTSIQTLTAVGKPACQNAWSSNPTELARYSNTDKPVQ